MAKKKNRKWRKDTQPQHIKTTPAIVQAPAHGHTTHVGGYTKPLPQCHSGPKWVMNIGHVQIYGARWLEVKHDPDWDIILRLTEGEGELPGLDMRIVSLNSPAKLLLGGAALELTQKAAIIDVRWPDFDTPNVGEEWWKALHAKLLQIDKPTNMVIHCFGGHGRTGTALAILAGLSGLVDANGDPVGYVRNQYCTSAVEANIQLQYISDITGLIIKSKPSFVMYRDQVAAMDKSVTAKPAGPDWWDNYDKWDGEDGHDTASSHHEKTVDFTYRGDER